MSSDKSTTKGSDKTSNGSEGERITLQPPAVISSLKTDVVNQNGILNDVGKTNKKVRKKKPKVKKVRRATGSSNKRETKRRKKVGNRNLKMLSDSSGTQITDEAKQNLEAPWQSYDGGDLGYFTGAKSSGFNEEKPEHNTWQNKVETEQEIQNKQKNFFFEELNDVALKFEHFALLVEEYFLVLDSLK